MLARSKYKSGKDEIVKHLHSKARQAVRGVEEAHGASIDTCLWRNPRHDQQKDFDKDE